MSAAKSVCKKKMARCVSGAGLFARGANLKKNLVEQEGEGGRRRGGGDHHKQSVCPTCVYDRPFHLLFIDVDRGHPGRRFFDKVAVVVLAAAAAHFWHGTTLYTYSLSWNGKGWWCGVEHIFEKSAARKGFLISTYFTSKIATALKYFGFFF